jgi:hypothetical protein
MSNSALEQATPIQGQEGDVKVVDGGRGGSTAYEASNTTPELTAEISGELYDALAASRRETAVACLVELTALVGSIVSARPPPPRART